MAAAARERERRIARLTRTCAQDQRTLLNVVHLEAIDSLLLNRHGEFQAPVEQDLEQQVFARSVGLHAANSVSQGCLHKIACRHGRVCQVRGIDLEGTEPNVNDVFEEACLVLEPGPGATDALPGEFGDRIEPC